MHNDFHQPQGLFPLFDGLEVPDLDKYFELDSVSAGDVTVNNATTASSEGDTASQPAANGTDGGIYQ